MTIRDWAAFYRSTSGRATRPFFDRTMTVWGDAPPGQAIDLGAGDGTETLALLERGWQVLSVDAEPASATTITEQVTPALAGRFDAVTASLEAVDLPPADLIYAGYSLPFLPGPAFVATWSAIRAALRPGGLVAADLFGPHDTWHSDAAMSFLDAATVRGLLAGLDVAYFHEYEEDGDAFSGAKHWHVIDVIARRPDTIGTGA